MYPKYASTPDSLSTPDVYRGRYALNSTHLLSRPILNTNSDVSRGLKMKLISKSCKANEQLLSLEKTDRLYWVTKGKLQTKHLHSGFTTPESRNLYLYNNCWYICLCICKFVYLKIQFYKTNVQICMWFF